MRHASIAATQLRTWSQLNDVQLNNTEITSNIVDADGSSKGGGLVSKSYHHAEDILLSVPKELVLCKDTMHLCAKSDHHLKQLLDVLEDFIQVSLLR